MPIPFHLDENVARSVAVGLRQRDIDVTTPADVDLIGASDREQLDFARKAGRIIVTHDDDFLRLHAQGVPHAGLAYCAPGSRSTREIIGGLLLISEILSPEDMQNHIEFL